ncbi:MAG: FliM/FliN family flagellar motor switch protein [Sphingopyxis sp.]
MTSKTRQKPPPAHSESADAPVPPVSPASGKITPLAEQAAGLPAFVMGDATAQTSALPVLDRINQRLERRLRLILEPIIQKRLAVTLDQVVTRSYFDWQADQHAQSYLTIFGLQPLESSAMLAINQPSISRFVDIYFGGHGHQTADAMTRELTPVEDGFARRISQSIIDALGGAWSEWIGVEPQIRSRETQVAFAALVPGDCHVIACRFHIAWDTDAGEQITILYPEAMLRAAQTTIAHGESGSHDQDSAVWKGTLSEAVGNIRFNARAILARPELPLHRLMQLKVGDFIPVTVGAHIPLSVANHVIATGTLGEQNGSAALMITQLEQGMSS